MRGLFWEPHFYEGLAGTFISDVCRLHAALLKKANISILNVPRIFCAKKNGGFLFAVFQKSLNIGGTLKASGDILIRFGGI